MSKTSRLADGLQAWAILPPILMLLVTAACLIFLLCPSILAAGSGSQKSSASTAGTVPATPTDSLKQQDDRIAAALETLKERTAAQQTLIGTLATLTGLYVAILSFAAYFRLQQTRDESHQAIERNQADFKDTRDDYDRRFEEFKRRIAEIVAEVRSDIPAVHGIGRRLESLLVDLENRLPVDGDWTNSNTYGKLGTDQKEQILVDEMVINSLDIFNVKDDLGSRRTISRLYVGIGQYYFSRATYLRKQLPRSSATLEQAEASLYRATLYFEKAIRTDGKDPVALRTRGVVLMHQALWLKEQSQSKDFDQTLLAQSRLFIEKSLHEDKLEPGACFAKAWLLVRATPADYVGAMKCLTTVIDQAPKLSARNRRKFLDFAYLNRANYTARLHSGQFSQNPAVIDTTSILQDLKEGMTEARRAETSPFFLDELMREIGKDGDLEEVYNRVQKAKDVIDLLIAG
jgi:hypothetical protein